MFQIVPEHFFFFSESIQTGSLYLVITGSTDGSIGIWDLTECVENFMKQIASYEMENCIEFQRRPRTGRGSQGGRRRRSMDSHKAKKKGNIYSVCDERGESGNEIENDVNGTSMFEESNDHDVVSGRKSDDLPETSVLEAIQVLHNIHQSGVNCLSVSDIKGKQRVAADSMLTFYVVSGGDDQAINYLRCDVEIDPMNMNCNHHFVIQNRHQITSAHSSSVKGIL